MIPAVYLTDAAYKELRKFGGETLQSVMDSWRTSSG
jgi:hypothetical protein